MISPYGTGRRSFYSSRRGAWAFRMDNDESANSGWNNSKTDTPGYCLAFDVTALVGKPLRACVASSKQCSSTVTESGERCSR